MNAKKLSKDSIIEFTYLIEKEVIIKFIGGREVEGLLKGYDKVGNLILDNVIEYINRDNDIEVKTRKLGCLFARGPNITAIFPKNNFIELENPY